MTHRQSAVREDPDQETAACRLALPLWFAAEDREYRRLLTYVGLPDLVIVRIVGETFERYLRNAIHDVVMRKRDAGDDATRVTVADLRRPLDEHIVRMKGLGYDARHRAYVMRGFSMILATTMRRIPHDVPQGALDARADALLAHWAKRGTSAMPASVDTDARDAVIRKTEKKSAFQRRMIFEVRAHVAMLAEESGRRKDAALTKRQRDKMRSYVAQETVRIWP